MSSTRPRQTDLLVHFQQRLVFGVQLVELIPERVRLLHERVVLILQRVEVAPRHHVVVVGAHHVQVVEAARHVLACTLEGGRELFSKFAGCIVSVLACEISLKRDISMYVTTLVIT